MAEATTSSRLARPSISRRLRTRAAASPVNLPEAVSVYWSIVRISSPPCVLPICARVALCLLALAVGPAGAQTARPDAAAAPAPPTARPQLDAVRLTTPPTIDGVLDDQAWTTAPQPLGDGWRSYNPLHGDAIAQHTSVWIAYDDKAVYFALT